MFRSTDEEFLKLQISLLKVYLQVGKPEKFLGFFSQSKIQFRSNFLAISI